MTRLLPALMLAGCMADAGGVRVLGPESVEVQWEAESEAVVAIVPVDLLAYDGLDGSALPGEDLHLRVTGGELATVDELVEGGPLWDVVGARPVDLLATEPALVLSTDELGAARVLVVIEGFDEVDGCAEPVELVVDAADAPSESTPLIVPIAPRMPCR